MEKEHVDYNIEFLHSYVDKFGNLEKIDYKNIEKTKEIIINLEKKGMTYSLNILIDDYTEETPKEINIKPFINEIEKNGLKPDYIIMESDLCNFAETLISYIPEKWKKKRNDRISFFNYRKNIILKNGNSESKTDYKFLFLSEKKMLKEFQSVKTEEHFDIFSDVTLVYREKGNYRYSCVLLASCWHLHRLGIDQFTDFLPNTIKKVEKPFFGKRSISILPRKYIIVESNANDLLSFVQKKAIKKATKKMELAFH